jgi:hypothetical protein
MARALARGVASSPTNPVLDVWTLVGGALTDVFALAFQVFDLSTGTPVQVFPATLGNQQVVNVAGAEHLQKGHYVATWTPGNAEPLGLHRVIWFVTPTNGGAVQQYMTDFDVLAAGLSMRGPAYALLSDLRTEGFTPSMLSDARAIALIISMSRLIERWTKRFFEPRYRSITLDGAAGPSMHINDPLIAVDSVTIDGTLVDLSSVKVFNRHISEGLTSPDDRDNPKIVFNRVTRTLVQVDSYDRPFLNRELYWPGPRNVAISALFGYTDPDADVQAGVTPDLIKRVTMLLVSRESIPIADGEGRADAQNAYRVKSIRTRDQSIDYGPDRGDLVTSGRMEFTGDPAIDDIIAQFVAPPVIGSC